MGGTSSLFRECHPCLLARCAAAHYFTARTLPRAARACIFAAVSVPPPRRDSFVRRRSDRRSPVRPQPPQFDSRSVSPRRSRFENRRPYCGVGVSVRTETSARSVSRLNRAVIVFGRTCPLSALALGKRWPVHVSRSPSCATRSASVSRPSRPGGLLLVALALEADTFLSGASGGGNPAASSPVRRVRRRRRSPVDRSH